MIVTYRNFPNEGNSMTVDWTNGTPVVSFEPPLGSISLSELNGIQDQAVAFRPKRRRAYHKRTTPTPKRRSYKRRNKKSTTITQ